MSRSEYEIRVVPSLLDRLLDTDPTGSRDAPVTRTESIRAFRDAVHRDLEHLLNSRNPLADLPPDFAELSQSVAAFGLPDTSSLSVASEADQQRLRHAIESTIRTFEPRLGGVTASLLPGPPTDRSLRVRVEARLLIEPVAEPVSYDIVLPVYSGKVAGDKG